MKTKATRETRTTSEVTAQGRARLLKGLLARLSLVVTAKYLVQPVIGTGQALREQHTRHLEVGATAIIFEREPSLKHITRAEARVVSEVEFEVSDGGDVALGSSRRQGAFGRRNGTPISADAVSSTALGPIEG